MLLTLVRKTSWNTVLIVSLCSIALPIAVSIILFGAQVASYGFPATIVALLSIITLSILRFGHRFRRLRAAETSWQHSWLVAGFIVLAVFLLVNQLIVRGLAVGIWDAEGELYPFQVLVSDFARSFRFLHWDPWSDGGIPLAGDPSVGAFSPLNLTIGLLTGGTSLGFRIYWLIVWFIGGLGILLLARQLKAPAWGGVLVSIGFLFCGVYTGNAEHTSCIVAFSLLPLIVSRLDKALVTRRLPPAVEAGALWGLSALSGYPALTITTGAFCALWGFARLTFRETDALVTESPASRYTIFAQLSLLFATLVLVFFVGMAVLSPTYYTFFKEGAGTSTRAQPLSREVAVSSNALEPGALATFASPYLAALKTENQLHGNGRMWPATDLSMCSIYSGTVVLTFAIFSILARSRDRWRWGLVSLAGLSIACALGASLPFRGWLYDWVYPMRFFRHPALFGFYVVFVISVLALIGVRDFQLAIKERFAHTLQRFLMAAFTCAAAALAVFLLTVSLGAEAPFGLKLGVLTWLIVSGAWLALVGLGLLLKFSPNMVKVSYIPVLLIAIAASDAAITSTVSQGSIASTEDQDLARWQSLDMKHSSTLDLTDNGLMREESNCGSNTPISGRDNVNLHSKFPCPFSDQLITKVPVLESYSTLTNLFHLGMANHRVFKDMATGSDRIWFCGQGAQVPATEDCFSALLARADDLRAPPLVIHSREDLLAHTEAGIEGENALGVDLIGRLPACGRIPVRLVRYDPEELAFDCDCPADGWLLVTDRWGPSWRAEVNGEPREVYAGDFIYRAIRVRAGENLVRFTYHPPLFPWLLILSWSTLGGTALWSLTSSLSRKRNPMRQPDSDRVGTL